MEPVLLKRGRLELPAILVVLLLACTARAQPSGAALIELINENAGYGSPIDLSSDPPDSSSVKVQ